jgi:hypothetical protein
MAAKIQTAFGSEVVALPLSQLLPLRKVAEPIRQSGKYLAIKASLQEIGLIEPLVVYPQRGRPDQFLLLDGTIRWDILKTLGESEALCLKATDDDSFTYNHKVCQLSPIQEHFMILRAIERGVSEERIAVTLNVNVAAIRRKRDLLNGICDEAVALLKDRRVSPASLREIRRVESMRQIEMAELMVAANNYSSGYAKCLYAATPESQKLPTEKPTEDRGLTPEDQSRMQREMEKLRREYRVVEATHGDNVLRLVPAIGYVRTLLVNARVERYLKNHHPDLRQELQRMIESPDLSPAES